MDSVSEGENRPGSRVGPTRSGRRLRVLGILPPKQIYYIPWDVLCLLPNTDATIAGEEEPARVSELARSHFLHTRFRSAPAVTWGASMLLAQVADPEELVRRTRPDVVVTFELHSAVSHQFSKMRGDHSFRHIVVSFETGALNSGVWSLFPPTRHFGLATAARVDTCVVGSESIERAALSVGVHPERIARVRLGVYPRTGSVPPFSSGHSRAGILFIGSLQVNKGLRTLVAAVDSAWGAIGPPGGLTIAGTGPLLDWLIDAAKLRPWLRIVGPVSENAKRELFDRSRLFVYPSEDQRILKFIRWQEQGGISVIEAMMHGLPGIVSDSGSLTELAPDPKLVVPQRSPIVLGRTMRRWLGDEQSLELASVKCLEYARLRHNIFEVASEFDRVVHSVLSC